MGSACRGILLALVALSPVIASAQPRPLGFRAVNVVDVETGAILPDQTVLVEEGRIAAVGPSADVELPEGAEVVDGTGRYLIPGLWDMHVHSVSKAEPGVPEPHTWHFPLFLAHGVTGVRNMNDATGDVTLTLTNAVKRALARGEVVGPRLVAAGPSVDGDPPLGSSSVVVRTAADARAVIDSLTDAGADFVKPYENLSREAYFALVDQAQRRGLPVYGHVPFRVGIAEAAEAGQRTIEHPEAIAASCSYAADAIREHFSDVLADYDGLPGAERFLVQFRIYRALYETRDSTACASDIDALRRNGVAAAVDLLAYHGVVYADEILADTAAMGLVPDPVRRNWEAMASDEVTAEFQSILRPILPLELKNARLLHESGVTLLASTDVGVPLQVPGLSLHRELVRLTEAGLTPLEALQAATLNPARAMGTADSLGTVEVGKLADLVLLDADPLADIANTQRIRAVVAAGRLYRRADLDGLVENARGVSRRSE
jgi:imidazolonepropionase-like amidohydrolase